MHPIMPLALFLLLVAAIFQAYDAADVLDEVDSDPWFNLFLNQDFPEHDCHNGTGPHANPYHPKRFYNCEFMKKRWIYTREFVCPKDHCFNSTSILRCDKSSCNGRSDNPEIERSCKGVENKHPTDPTRQFQCVPNDNGTLEYSGELRCAYGLCATGQSAWPCGDGHPNCFSNELSKANTSNPSSPVKPPFPKIPDDEYMKWDDMYVPKTLFDQDNNSSRTRNAIPNKYYLWPTHTIPYYIDETLEKYINNIEAAVKDINDRTCIKLRRWAPDMGNEYIYISRGDVSCYSFVGMRHTGGQQLILTVDCAEKVGVIIHELMHAIGFFHEHSRSDRDEYLDIFFDNIENGTENNWRKLPPFGNILFGNFTKDSIMLYSSYSGSKIGTDHRPLGPTMLLKDGKELPGIENTVSMSEIDAMRVNALYNCTADP